MKRHLVSLFCLFVLFALPASAQQTDTMRVNASTVNLRKAPSVDSGIVRSLAKGTLVAVVSHDGNWVQVKLPGQSTSGWVRSDLLVAASSSSASSMMAPASGSSSTPAPAPQRSAVAPPPASAPSGAPARGIAPPPPPKAMAPAKMASASDDSYHAGFTIFGGITSFSVNVTPTPTGETIQNASGFAAGLGVIAHLGGPIGLEFDAAYVQGGFEATDGANTLTEHDNNVGGALLLRPAFGSGPVRFFLVGGADIAYLINCTETETGVTTSTCKVTADQNRTNYSAVIGGGVSFGPLAVQLRYDAGLANLNKTAGETVKSKGIQVLASLIL